MWVRCSRVLRARSERGLYFPINHRIVDQRNTPQASCEEADIQARHRRHLRSSFMTGETRQSEPPAWSRRSPPTHFLALPVPARCSLRVRVKEMHNSMVFSHQHVGPLLTPLAKLHVTLGVLTVADEPQATSDAAAVAPAATLLTAIQDCIDQACHDTCTVPLQLRFRGLGTFGDGRVLFVRCVSEANFTTLDALVQRIRRDVGLGLGVDIKGNPHDSYVPHVTVAKIRRSQAEEFGRHLPRPMWVSHQHDDFGDVTFSKVDLCSMKGQGKDGYYNVVSSSAVARQ